ncbi:hypothetical protein [Spirosoma rhododendri]|uniref:DUF11 domain-containing protein n=1 Tax=Spirosoma rhododendri TaxID=2728024 RepID=A0A7L5DFS6_9BACT|nr:hypothetical protein [Spirosoma rhododendri]QJD77004.1 hypothetical protein HH216_00175 [Spirosoma rhododendri]
MALNGGSYSVRLSTTSATIGTTAPAPAAPANWVFTGEGTAAAGDGTPNGITSVTLTTANLSGVNFGLDQLPTPTSATLVSQANPGGTNGVSIPPASFTGTDPDGTVASIRYTAFPSNVTSMTIGTTLYTALTFPAGGVTAATGTAVTIDPTDGNVTAVIPFRVIDNAGQESTTTGTLSVPFTGLSVSGTVFDDGNGLTDNLINGTGTNAGGLFVNLVDATGNVAAVQALPATGVYSFSNVATGVYSVRLSTTTVAVGSAAPAVSVPTGWTFTGEGTATAGDGTPNGSTQVTLTTASVAGVNFGLDQLPVPTSLTISARANTTGTTTGYTVPPSSFTGTDADGTISAVRYTAFPSNTTSLTIGATVYTSANFPTGGVTATTGTTVLLDPVDGNVTANIPFRLIDNAGQEGTTTGNVGVPFLVTTDLCNSQILFFNEDFGAGVGFGPPLSTTTVPGYTYTSTDPINDGSYGIVNNPDQGDDFATQNVWLHGPDHTGNPNGRMLLINGSNPNQIAYTQPVSGLTVGRQYSLRTYITNIFNQAVLGTGEIKPNLILQVRDGANNILTSVSTGDIAATSTLTWLPYSLSFTASTSSIKFELISNANAGNGNDFALDDIQFFEVIQPVLSTTAVTSTCPATSADISGITATNRPTSTTLTWHSSATATAANRISDVTALRSGTYYASFTDGTCFSKTSPFVVLIVPCANPDAGITISAGVSGTVVANVAANDFVNGQPATLGTGGNATVAQVGTYPTGVTLNTTTGSLSVTAGTAPGSYTVAYQLCDKLTPVNCATAVATFSVAPLLSGTVFSDPNGLTDNAINGTGTNAGGLFVILTDATSGTVVANAAVSSAGAYSFTGLTARTYQIQLSTSTATVGSAAPAVSVPAGYTVTGEGIATAGDGTPNGITNVTVTATASVTGVNFGIEQLPVSTSSTLTAQANPGGTNGVTIAPSSFTGTDPDGTVAAIRYTAFPTNVDSFTIGGTVYTSANFPTGGVTAVTGTTVRLDPKDGAVTAVIPFRVIDNAGVESANTASVSVPFTYVLTASPDAGTASAGTGGTAVPNVAANDLINGQPATLGTNGNATVVTVGTYPTGVTLNTTTGSISVAQGTTPGSYTVAYQLCDKLSTPTCTTTTAVITVTPSVTATPDAGTVSSGTGGTAVANVAANDVVNGQPATLGNGGNATVATVGTYPAGITLNTTTGSISVAQGTAPGSYTVAYQLCDKLTPTTCSTAIVSLTVTAAVVANPDAGLTISAATSGTVVANVAANDFVNGQPTTLGTGGNATVAQVGTYPAGVTLNTTTGSLSVAAGTAPGSYTVTYQLCDKLTPATCSTAIATFTVTPTLSGTVFNDANGLTDNLVNGTGTNAGGLFAILTNAASTSVLASVPVNSSGAYSFTGLTAGTYSVRLSTTSAVVGAAPPAASVPTGYTFTGEGTAPAGDGTPDGSTQVTLTNTASLTGVNFGLDQLPTPTTATLASQANPGGINGVSIPPASFTGTDPDGTVASIRYTAFPSNVTSMTIGTTLYTALTFPAGGVTAATGTAVIIDPTDGNVTAVIPFRVIDNAGQESTTTGTLSVPFTGLSVSGTVFDDGNGLTDNLINGTGTNAGGLFVNLVDATGNVAAVQALPATGVYSFSNVATGVYSVRLSTTTVAVGSAAPAVSVPTGWTFTGEGTAAAGDGTPNGSTQVTLTTASVSGVNFGLDQLPVSSSSTLTAQANPGGTTGVVVPPASFTGTDPDGTVVSIRYTAFPTNTTSLTIGSTVYTSANFPAGGVTVATGTAVAIDPIDGAVTAVIPFRAIDNAGVESTTTGSVSVPFTTLTLSGTVFDDGNGLTDNTINGTGTNAGGLFAILTDAASGTVIAVTSVASTGTYSFAALNGGSYSVRLSTTSATVGATAPAPSAPANWVFTGEGTAAAGDGTPNGVTSVTLTTANVSGVNFGLDQLPTATSSTLASQANPGGTNGVTIAPSSFTGTDPDGTIASIRYTAFPTNTTSLTIGTVTYTSANFPAGGVTAVTGTTVRLDPVDGAVTAVIPFRVIDNAGVESSTATTASVSVPFTYVLTASPDAGTVSSGTGGTAVANVAANDLINGQPATLGTNGNATVASVGTYPAGITLSTTTGSISVAQGTAPGSYTLVYQLCDKLSTPTCTTTTAVITVTPSVTASPDAGTVSSGTGGTAVANIAANDVVNGQPAMLGNGGNATVAQVGTYPPGVTLNPATGSLSVAQGTAPGSYTVAYQLCDKLSTPTCTTTTAVITVTPSVTASPDAGTVSSGTGGTAVANVAANDVVNGQPATLGNGGNATIAQVGTYPTGVTLNTTTGSLSVAAGTAPGSYTVAYQLCDKLTPATCTTSVVSFTVTPSIGGTVFSDPNGLTDNTINGTGTNAGGLFVALVNGNNTVVASVSVSPTGTYRFDNVAPGTYDVRLSTTSAVVGAAPPAASVPTGYTFTGEGTAPAGDGTPNGITSITVTATATPIANFGIEQLPTPTSTTLVARANPGGTNAITVPPSSLTGTDPDGTVASIHYVSFPTYTTTLYIGNTAYTAATFPVGGIIAASNLPVHLDPANDANGVGTSVISFRVLDNAGIESTTTATATIPFTCVATFCPPVTGKKISSR